MGELKYAAVRLCMMRHAWLLFGLKAGLTCAASFAYSVSGALPGMLSQKQSTPSVVYPTMSLNCFQLPALIGLLKINPIGY